MRKRDGSLIDYQYDALNRMTVKIVPPRGDLDSTHTRDVYYAYDLRGLQTEARFDSLTGEGVSSRYDGFGRLLQSTLNMDGVARTVRSQYDRNGNRTQLTHPDGQVFTYSYDGLNRPLGIYQGAGTSVMLDLFAYNVQGLVGARTEPNGSGVGYAYDPLGRLTSQTDTFAGGTGNVVRGFDYNPASQVRSGTRDNDAYAWTGHFASTSAYTTNGRNQYTIATPRAYSYDANGNLRTDTASTFVYDIENRLVTATGVRTSTLRYDPLGRLYEVASPTGTTQRFTYDGDALIAVNNGSNGALLERFVHGGNPAADDPLVWYNVGAVRALHSDHQGSIVAITASNSGAVASINAYDEYGNQNGANVGRFRYTGQAWIEELGLYYYKARMYSPTIGRFMQVDPVGYEDQVNLYAYVGNDPVNRADPTGRDAIVLMRENGRVEIILPMTFTGDAATPQNVAAAIQNIQSAWTGRFDGTNVTTTVVQGRSPLDPDARNTMRIVSGNTSQTDAASGHQGHSFVRNGRVGEVTMQDVNGTPIAQPSGPATFGDKGLDTYAHEGGHYMGAPDRPAGGSLMGTGGSNRVTGDDIRAITQNNPPSGGRNTVIQCSADERC